MIIIIKYFGWVSGREPKRYLPSQRSRQPPPYICRDGGCEAGGGPVKFKKESQIYLHPAPSCATPGSAAAKQQPTLLQGSV